MYVRQVHAHKIFAVFFAKKVQFAGYAADMKAKHTISYRIYLITFLYIEHIDVFVYKGFHKQLFL